MKKCFYLLVLALISVIAVAQTNQVVWNDGQVQFAVPITNVDSLTFPTDNALTVDTLHLLLPRSMKQIVHDTIYQDRMVAVHDTIYLYDCNYCNNIGFSVSASQQVRFASGNLRCITTTTPYTWYFAEHQYDILGDANVKNSALADTIDLFGWSSDNTAAPFGVSTSTTASDYSGNFVDWGTKIGDGSTWRTLSMEEWVYLLKTRTNATSLYGVACIYLTADSSQYVNGLILLPDNWQCPNGITFKSGYIDMYSYRQDTGQQKLNIDPTCAEYQSFSLSQWLRLENAGAIFLPLAGDRNGTNIEDVQERVSYWSSTLYSTERPYNATFSVAEVAGDYVCGISMGISVRLVQNK